MKNDIVCLKITMGGNMGAKDGSVAIVVRGRRGKSPFFQIVWIDTRSMGQCDGLYYPADFIKIGQYNGKKLPLT